MQLVFHYPMGLPFTLPKQDPVASILCYMGVAFVGNEEFLLRTEGLQEATLAAFVMLLWIGVHNSWNLKSNDEWVAGNKAAAEYWQSLIAAGSKGQSEMEVTM